MIISEKIHAMLSSLLAWYPGGISKQNSLRVTDTSAEYLLDTKSQYS